MNTFCPFLKDACRTDCVFRVCETSADEETITVCRLVSSAAVNSELCNIIIKEKNSENER